MFVGTNWFGLFGEKINSRQSQTQKSQRQFALETALRELWSYIRSEHRNPLSPSTIEILETLQKEHEWELDQRPMLFHNTSTVALALLNLRITENDLATGFFLKEGRWELPQAENSYGNSQQMISAMQKVLEALKLAKQQGRTVAMRDLDSSEYKRWNS